ncbi:hypothetical protein B0T24DRAFT_677442 [Lasiosphaeria ovina]|uniref:Uncharacterized protein n=1 Tax=Lasiosphaeria ovina TaxID=92902 RepID=A0AAE0KIN0_9PEZI|nr:hypothetical protein B0T24DRAFT_677442 [Lasiosphaeria ovina]
MKGSFVRLLAISACAWLMLRLADAACCRLNVCLKAIVAPIQLGINGIEGCSLLLTSTLTLPPVHHNRRCQQRRDNLTTIVESTTVATEVSTFTVTSSLTAATETGTSTAKTTVVVTTTSLPTTTIPAVRQTPGRSFNPSLCLSCPSWEKHVSACSCAGVTATTVTASVSTETVTVSTVDTAISTAVSTLTLEIDQTVSLTAKTSTTKTDVLSLTATTATTVTDVSSTTTTVATVTTATAACATNVAPFKAQASDYQNTPLQIFAQFASTQGGSLTWAAPSSAPGASVQNRFIWGLDSAGRLYLANSVPSFPFL